MLAVVADFVNYNEEKLVKTLLALHIVKGCKALRDCNEETVDSIKLTVRTKELYYTIGKSLYYIYLGAVYSNCPHTLFTVAVLANYLS